MLQMQRSGRKLHAINAVYAHSDQKSFVVRRSQSLSQAAAASLRKKSVSKLLATTPYYLGSRNMPDTFVHFPVASERRSILYQTGTLVTAQD